jgi:HEAT repeat protein
MDDPMTRGLVHIGVAQVLAAGLEAGELELLDEKVATARMLRTLDTASTIERGYAALALGHLLRAVTDEMAREGVQQFREDALGVLRKALASESQLPRVRAAAAIALGMARDWRSRRSLREILAHEGIDLETRSASAWALGLIGEPTAETAKALWKEASVKSSVELRRRSVRALALLGQPRIPGTNKDAVDLLLEDLAKTEDLEARVDTVVLLARFGDHRAIAPLVAILEDDEAPLLLRSMAASALGAIGDLELVPGLDLLRRDAYHLERGETLDQVFKFL